MVTSSTPNMMAGISLSRSFTNMSNLFRHSPNSNLLVFSFILTFSSSISSLSCIFLTSSLSSSLLLFSSFCALFSFFKLSISLSFWLISILWSSDFFSKVSLVFVRASTFPLVRLSSCVRSRFSCRLVSSLDSISFSLFSASISTFWRSAFSASKLAFAFSISSGFWAALARSMRFLLISRLISLCLESDCSAFLRFASSFFLLVNVFKSCRLFCIWNTWSLYLAE